MVSKEQIINDLNKFLSQFRTDTEIGKKLINDTKKVITLIQNDENMDLDNIFSDENFDYSDIWQARSETKNKINYFLEREKIQIESLEYKINNTTHNKYFEKLEDADVFYDTLIASLTIDELMDLEVEKKTKFVSKSEYIELLNK